MLPVPADYSRHELLPNGANATFLVERVVNLELFTHFDAAALAENGSNGVLGGVAPGVFAENGNCRRLYDGYEP